MLTVPIILLIVGLAMLVAGLYGKKIPITASLTIPKIERGVVRTISAIMGFGFVIFSIYLFEPELFRPTNTKTSEKKVTSVEEEATPATLQEFNIGKLTFITDHAGNVHPLTSYLKEYGVEISLLKTQELNNLADTRPDIIIVGADTGKFWASQSESILGKLFEDYKVIGIGDGGARLFHQLELEIGWGHGMHGRTSRIQIKVPELLQSPLSIPTSDKVVEVLSSSRYDVVGIYDSGSPIIGGFEGIARWEDHQNHWPIVRQGNYVLWAFDAPTNHMTDEGKQLFINLLVNHQTFPFTPLPVARKKPDYVIAGLISDSLNRQFSHHKWDFKIQKTGRIKATLMWDKQDHGLALILNGPGQVGYFAREDGYSPLTIEFDVTEEHITKGTDWSISVKSFEDLGDTNIDFKLQLSFP